MAATFGYFGTESGRIRSVNLEDGTSTCYPVAENNGQYVAIEWLVSKGRLLYALVCYWKDRPGDLVEFRVLGDGSLKELARVPSGGMQPCHAAFRPGGGGQLGVSHYFGGCVSLFACSAKAPPQCLSRVHVGEHAHGIAWSANHLLVAVADKVGSVATLLANDLAIEQIQNDATVSPMDHCGLIQDGICRLMGHRPRHLAFASETSLLVLHECANTLTLHTFDPVDGAVSPVLQSVSTLFDLPPPSWFCGIVNFHGPEPVHAAAELLCHSTGRGIVAYVSNREICCGSSSVAAFAVSDLGLRPLGSPVETYRNPRHILLDEKRDRLLVGCTGKVMLFPFFDDGPAGLGEPKVLGLPSDEGSYGSRVLDCSAIVDVGGPPEDHFEAELAAGLRDEATAGPREEPVGGLQGGDPPAEVDAETKEEPTETPLAVEAAPAASPDGEA